MEKAKKGKLFKTVILVLRMLSLVVPLGLFIILFVLFPASNRGFVIPGLAGCLVTSIGLEFVIDHAEKTSVGWKITVITTLTGLFLSAGSLTCMYMPEIKGVFDEAMTDYYFLLWPILFALSIVYCFSRMLIKQMLRSEKRSNTAIKKSMKGLKNYWFYEDIHQQYGLGFAYHANKIFLIFWLASLILHGMVDWWFAFSPVISGCLCGACLSVSVFSVGISARFNHWKHQHLIMCVFFPLLLGYFICSLTLQMWSYRA